MQNKLLIVDDDKEASAGYIWLRNIAGNLQVAAGSGLVTKSKLYK